MRGIFFDEDDAREVERRLDADGYQVELARVTYAGEDDDEGHPWAVTTDAPDVVLELLVDHFDGWLDDEPSTGPLPPQPFDLPAEPKRHHRPPS